MELGPGIKVLSGEPDYYTLSGHCPVGIFDHSTLESVHLPPTLRELGAKTFMLCKNLKVIELPQGLEKIGKQCFCCDIEQISIPSSVMHIGHIAFSGCHRLQSVVFEEGSKLESVGKKLFDGCKDVIVYVNFGMKFDIEAHISDVSVVRLPQLDVRVGDGTLRGLRKF